MSPQLRLFIDPVVSAMGGLAAVVCTFMLVWAGISYITSSGNPEKLQSAKKLIVRSLLGLTIVFAALSITLILVHAYSESGGLIQHKLPILTSIKPVKTGGGLVAVLIDAITGVLKDIIETIAKPFIQALSYFTKSTPLLTHSSSVMHLWVITTGIADALMVLVIALLGFHVMGGEHLGLGHVSLSSLVPRILAAFVLINTSIYILDGTIELSNAMITAVRAGIGSVTPWQSLLEVIGGVSVYSLPALIIFVIFLVFTVILLIYYIGRIVVLYLGAILSPIVIILWLLPSFRDFAENALKAYMATIFVLFVHVIILALAGSLFLGISQVGGTPDPLMSLLLGLATLIALIKTQGVLMQLNYASIGPRTARRLGGSFVNGVSYLSLGARYGYSQAVAPVASVVGEGARRIIPESKPKTYVPTDKIDVKGGKS